MTDTFRNQTAYPFCPGCGHSLILDRLNEALVSLGEDPQRVVLVTDIGCCGLSDQYFVLSGFHGLHGRSITYATGLKLARPEMTVIVIMGDGGTGIGGTHLLHAAKRNVGIKVLVCNNLNFGMTGGQHSSTSPPGSITSTTPLGHLERPLDICATAAVNGAGYVYRGTTFEKDLSDRMVEAFGHPGFALLDIWEMCTAYYVPRNQLSGKALQASMAEAGMQTGVLQKAEVREYATAYREATRPVLGQPTLAPRPLEARYESGLTRPFRLVVAGSAGGKVRSAARLVAEAGILSNLWAAQRDDYPITVQTGHSLADLILSPRPIRYTAVTRPDAVVVLTDDGLHKAAKHLSKAGPDQRIFTVASLAGAVQAMVPSRTQVTVLGPSQGDAKVKRSGQSLMALSAVVKLLDLFPREALQLAASRGPKNFANENLQAVAAGWAMVGDDRPVEA
jgi:pyruvate/2-oxoacid:ferredoxin oxidoreductase beta subunit/Pyruvate/2-oxoacid:ferredoxin oxidoreductase gamma subunit